MIVFTVSLRQGRGQLENLGFIHIGDLVFIRWDGNKMAGFKYRDCWLRLEWNLLRSYAKTMNRANESLLLRLN